jgi:hypothetical protein
MATDHPDYAILGGRVAVSMLHNKTKEKFSEVMPSPSPLPHSPLNQPFPSPSALQVIQALYDYIDQRTGRSACLIRHVASFSPAPMLPTANALSRQ